MYIYIIIMILSHYNKSSCAAARCARPSVCASTCLSAARCALCSFCLCVFVTFVTFVGLYVYSSLCVLIILLCSVLRFATKPQLRDTLL